MTVNLRRVVLTALASLLVVVPGLAALSSYHAEHERVTTICYKERDEGQYRIYTDTGTYVVTDVFFSQEGARFDSADAYGKLQEGETYAITYKGWRVPPLSMFQNITSAEPAPDDVTSSGNGCQPD